jgi:formylglycine-generating enzyme required for sulfatase activity
MLVGGVPFEGSTIAVVITKTLSEDPQPAHERNPEVSQGTGLVVQKMMAKEREARYRTPTDLVEDLEEVIAGRYPIHAVGTSGAPSGLTRAGMPVTPAGAARTALTGAARTGVAGATTPTLEARAATAGQMVPARGAKRGLLVPVLLGVAVIVAAVVAAPFVLKGLAPREGPAEKVEKKEPPPTEPTRAGQERKLAAEDERDWHRAKAEARSRASNGDHVGALATVDGFLGSARTAKFNAEATELRAEIETKRAEVEEKRRAGQAAEEKRKAEEAAEAKRIARRKAEEEARRAARKPAKSEAERMLERAQDAEKNGELSAALTFYRAAGKQGADVRAKIEALEKQIGYGAALVRAREQMAAEKWKAAVASLEKLLAAHPGDKAARALLAEAKKNIGPDPALTFDLGGGVKLQMIYIKPGRFMMGSARGWFDERPVHEVVLTKGFYLGKYEVTQSQFKTLTGVNRSRLKGEEHPVVEVSWPDADDFCKRLSKKTGRNFRLPTEAEWEYAARAGSTGKYSYGNDEKKLGDYAWYKLNSKNKTHPVGLKLPNSWGLHDMPGNVWEWCADWHYKGYYGKSPREDPKGPDRSTGKRVVRGGCYDTKAATCTVSERNATRATGRERDTGFRVAMDP